MTVTLLGLVIGWILTGFLGVLAVMILIKIWKGDIDLNYIISDENGWASLSRFQFLIFTFVVAMSLFYLIVANTPPKYPIIPNEILALLGISGGSYVLSKGIQNSRDVSMTAAGVPPEQKDPKITNTPVTGPAETTDTKTTTQTTVDLSKRTS
jgi:uncharacterized BrkB/YihY/UPF0761 family membrane protein